MIGSLKETVDTAIDRLKAAAGNATEPTASSDDKPMRAELFTVSQLEQHAKTVAGWHKINEADDGGPDRLLPRLVQNEVALREAHTLLTDAVKSGARITPAAEWLIDNYHLVEEQIRTARRHLPKGYNRELPKLLNGPSAGTPRVYDIALELISHSHGRVDLEGLLAFVASYQTIQPLLLGELWAIPIMLRLALIENLRRVVANVTAGRRDRQRAGFWVERMLAVSAKEPANVVLVLADMIKESPPLTSPFVSELTSRLQGQGPALLFPLSWLEHRLAEQGNTIEQVFQLVSQSQAAHQVDISNTIGSLRFLGSTDWRDFVENTSVVERALRSDPAGVYAKMDFATRNDYRHAVEEITKRSPSTELQVAEFALDLCNQAPVTDSCQRHVGYFFVGEGRARLEKVAHVRLNPRLALRRLKGASRLLAYVGSIALVTAAATGVLALWAPEGLQQQVGSVPWQLAAAIAVSAICCSQFAVGVVNWIVTLLVRPHLLPRLNFANGIPSDHAAVVAVPTLLTDAAELDELLNSLEIRFLANRDDNLTFALLSDFRDAPTATKPEDAAILQHAREGIEALNRKYRVHAGVAKFFLFHRERKWNPRENVWMGWERKRGKLLEFNAALRGELHRFDLVVGDTTKLVNAKYVIALDSDTQLPRDAAHQLVGTLAHPLNRAYFDEKKGRVTSGYTILQPRVAITMDSSRRSRFAKLFSGEPGIDPYTRAVSDVYQDVFGEGSFVGKAIYDVDSFRQAVGARLPENRVLSHDLLEGTYARAGLVSDVTLFEDYPSAYAADVNRRHRWMRGDWQIVPWLFARVPSSSGRRVRNPASALSRWKIFDNLRRSIVPMALLSLLVLGWGIPGAALFATVATLAILLLPGLLTAAAELARRPSELPFPLYAHATGRTLLRQAMRELFALACLPYDAWVAFTSVTVTAWRVVFTRRKLLQWRTASDAQRNARTSLAGCYASMWIAPLSALTAVVHVGNSNAGALGTVAIIAGLWALCPALTWWVSQPISKPEPNLSAQDVVFLRAVARRTWRFFETFVAEEDNYLPPDNFQEDPPQGIAHRTSPTNIGLALTANLAAYDFGYVVAGDVLQKTAQTFATLDKLQRYRGHFFNWYDTRSLEPLRPMYVSTVDSGNLAGHLLTLAMGLREFASQPIFRKEIFAGLRDVFDLMQDAPSAGTEATATLSQLLQVLTAAPPLRLAEAKQRLQSARTLARVLHDNIAHDRANNPEPAADKDRAWWARAFDVQCGGALNDLVHMAPWLDMQPAPVTETVASIVSRLQTTHLTLADTARLAQTMVPALDDAGAVSATMAEPLAQAQRSWLDSLQAAIRLASERASLRIADANQLAVRCEEFSDIEYEFLYLRDRHLLSIGYNMADHRLDVNCYDLLASEARLASFVAIAQGKLPQEHWFSLGRLLTNSGGRPSLLSWSGSMFEYLMPLLVMPSYDNTVLQDTNEGVVDLQIEYGRELGVPWGVSESGYNKTDAQLNYQYRAFGVPGLGFKRGLANDLVIAPYASAMALMVRPDRACANLQRMQSEGLLGDYGFYEAVDYTPERLPRGKARVTVRSYMVHHQAMAFLSYAHVLLNQPMQRRFSANPAFAATNLLLQERVPLTAPIKPNSSEVSIGERLADDGEKFRVFTSPSTTAPQVHLLSNGNYHVAITNSGGGYSRWRDLAVTRWYEDPTRDCWGTFCYVRDVGSQAFWSVAHQPTLRRAQTYEAIYSEGRAEFRRRDGDIDTHVEISVSPEDDIELRRFSITNRGRTARTIELTSFAEVVLAPPAADAAHPAFSNLFVQTELLRQQQAILCSRRPRSGSERPPWMLHLMTVQGTLAGPTSYETGRAEFIGRGRSVQDPVAMHREYLSNSEGSVLDPIVAIRNTVVIAPHETLRVHLVTGIAETRVGALALIDKYSDRHSSERVLELSWTHSQVVLRRLDITEADTQLYERLAGSVLYANPVLRAPRSVILRNRRGQSALWAYGISGDLPIILIRVAELSSLPLVRQLVKAHAYLQLKGLATDLVIWNEDASGYRQVLQEEIMSLIAVLREGNVLDRPGGIFVRRAEQLSEEDKVLMQTVARLIVNGSEGGLSEQISRRVHTDMPPALFPDRDRRRPAPLPEVARTELSLQQRPDLSMFNGLGGFSHDGREYVILTSRTSRTPAPWVNVLANPWFGTVVSESGGAYTWCENAHSYRLTPWHNDPVGDPSGEAFYVRDEETGQFWSPTPLPAAGNAPYTTRHGFGYSVFEHDEHGLQTELRTFVATDAPLKFVTLQVRNKSGRPRRLTLTAFFELVLGSHRSANMPHVVTEIDLGGAVFARNSYSSEFSGRVAFLDCSEKNGTSSGDRLEFIGRNGSLAQPACMQRARLSGRVGAGLDPCLATQVVIDLADGQAREVVFMFGSGSDLSDARLLTQRFAGRGGAQRALDGVSAYWQRTLGAVNIVTPDASLNYLTNGWLLYQVLAARIWGRSGFYQSGGAFGFRDQLQDAMALIHAEPSILREQILRSAGQQFREGDVQHWWHPPTGRGVRTHISDDYLWMPYAVCRYVKAVGDTGVLGEKIAYLEGRRVQPEEESYYDLPTRSEELGTVYDHCVLAIKNGLRFGAHGLPLMGGGDWNDGMNLVGEHGKGESVWLAFFLYDVLIRFVDLAKLRNDHAFAEFCTVQAEQLRQNIERNSWDGGWYRRAYFDNGDPLGSSLSPECQIDSLPQSWAVLSGAGEASRAKQGLAAVQQRLVRRDLKLIQLFDPPFDTSDLRPGYIKGYVPGVRENGGQYTHAAVWVVMAFAAMGDHKGAWELFDLINPVRHGDTAAAIATYKVEPYVVAADVYTNPQHAGRGGWTWYTGSAGWMYRLITESLLGLRLQTDRLFVTPLLPDEWNAIEVHYRYRDTTYHIHIKRRLTDMDPSTVRVICDGVEQPDGSIPLADDRLPHNAEVEFG